jgi:hypothetical protein
MRTRTRYRPTAPCEECGGRVIVALAPAEDDEPGLLPGQTHVGLDFCTNRDCASNHLRGLTRVGGNEYECTVCGLKLSGLISVTFDHRRQHIEHGELDLTAPDA